MNIVTISRQVGSLGDLIAALVAEKMGLELVGRDQIHQMAQTCDPDYREFCTTYESEHGPGFFERLFFDRPSCTSLFEALTFETASRGNVVIVGRGAQVVLRNVPGVFRVRIVAPDPIRVERIRERHHFSPEEAEDFVKRYDHERNNLIRFIFLSDLGDWALYDMILNTAHFSAGTAADLIIEGMNRTAPVPDPEGVKQRLRNMGLAKRIQTLLRRRLTSGIARHLEISVEPAGVVKMSGRISEQKYKENAEQIVAEYPGVIRIDNQIKVTNLAYGM